MAKKPEKENQYVKYLKPIGNNFYACNGCGKDLREGDLVCDCAECGAMYCEECVRDGTFENHDCQD